MLITQEILQEVRITAHNKVINLNDSLTIMKIKEMISILLINKEKGKSLNLDHRRPK